MNLLGAPSLIDANRHNMKSLSTAFARACGYIYMSINELHHDIFRCPDLISAPIPYPPRQAMADAVFTFGLPPKTLGCIGAATPLSAQHILGLLTSPNSCRPASLVAFASTGAAFLTKHGPRAWRPSETIPDGDWAHVHYGRPCPFCPGHWHVDIWHILFDCINPSSVRLRPILHRKAASFLSRDFVPLTSTLLSSVSPTLRQDARSALSDVVTSLPNFEWSSPPGSLFLFRLLLVIPFPACAAFPPSPNSALMHHFGTLCDMVLVRNTDLRQLANSWVWWAGSEIESLVSSWSSDVDSLLLQSQPLAVSL